MKIAVQKFGGTSLTTTELRSQVGNIVSSTISSGKKVVVVVSAIGRDNDPYATDTLIKLVKEINQEPLSREMDLLMSCGEIISGVLLTNYLSSIGIKARFFTGEQAGIVTDGNFGNAHVLYVNPRNILDCLEKGVTPVVAGFQGISENEELTTLGRGGSDTTASALGVALNAEIIDIFTDVEGIMTADPRIVSNARLLEAISYNEICQLAREGARVVNPRAIEIAMQGNVPLRVRSTSLDNQGTLISNQLYDSHTPRLIKDQLITGITYTSNLTQIKIENSNNNGAQLELNVFQSLADAGISVDFINVQLDRIVFTIQGEQAESARQVLKGLNIEPQMEMNCAKVAVVGAAMTGIPGVMANVVAALNNQEINILQSGDSYTNIWCLVKENDLEKAVNALHDKFELGN
ncbi:MAG: aspartate kinase [Syntrophomonadaceae bacterium]|nr:aspartate kinase [Syntrophomonadaceae bacterium]